MLLQVCFNKLTLLLIVLFSESYHHRAFVFVFNIIYHMVHQSLKANTISITSGYVFAGNFVVKTVAVAEAEVVAWR